MNTFRLLTLISALVFAAIGMSAPLITLYLEQLGSSYSQISLILASAGLIGLLSNYLWGRASDRLGRRKPLVAGGLLGAALAYTLLAGVTQPVLAWAVRLGEAAALAAYGTASLALMGDVLGGPNDARRRGTRMGLYRGLGSLAFAAGAVVGGRLADIYSLRVMLAGCALLYGLAGFVALLLHELPLATTPSPSQTPSQSAPKPRAPRAALPVLFLVGVFLWMAAHMGASSMWPNYMSQISATRKSAISGLWGWAAFVEAPSDAGRRAAIRPLRARAALSSGSIGHGRCTARLRGARNRIARPCWGCNYCAVWPTPATPRRA